MNCFLRSVGKVKQLPIIGRPSLCMKKLPINFPTHEIYKKQIYEDMCYNRCCYVCCQCYIELKTRNNYEKIDL